MTDTSKYIFLESQKYFNKNKNKNFLNYSTNIPIVNTISNIEVGLNIIIQKFMNELNKYEYYGIVKIFSPKITIGDSCENYSLFYHRVQLKKFSIEYIENFLLEFKNLLKTLKFDKLYGKFESNMIINTDKIGLDLFGLEYSTCNDCSVCFEKTYTKTACNHSLCIECWSKMKNDKCPICRTYLEIDEDEYMQE